MPSASVNTQQWQISPSPFQTRLTALFLLCSWLLLTPLFSWITLGLLALIFITSFLGWYQHLSPKVISHSSQGWRLHQSTTRPLYWRAGSIKRPKLILWKYGVWPWQCLIIRPDSVATNEFTQLQRLLAVTTLRS